MNTIPSDLFNRTVDHLHTLSEIYRNIATGGIASTKTASMILNLEERMHELLNSLPKGQV